MIQSKTEYRAELIELLDRSFESMIVNEEIKLSKKEAIKNTPSTLNINVPHIITCVGGCETKGWIDQTQRYIPLSLIIIFWDPHGPEL